MKNILLVFGTRPEAIKMAPLYHEFRKYPELFCSKLCVTAQHRELLDNVLSTFRITPDFDLNVMKTGQDLCDITIHVMDRLRDVLRQFMPDLVFVHGDTTTSLAAALSAFYMKIPVAHVEAGLRTHNRYDPWPEEMNRSLTGRIATWHFAPTELAKNNLLDENILDEHIMVTGNTAIDALHWALNRLGKDPKEETGIKRYLVDKGYDTDRLKHNRKLVVITGHRRENFGERILHICHAVRNLSLAYPEADFVYPVHLNPNVRNPVREILSANPNGNMFLLEPLEYLPFIYVMSKSYLILTDSGGIQEEAPGLGKPVLVTREVTERPEAVDAGTVKVVGTERIHIENGVHELMNDAGKYQAMSNAGNPYGDGKAAERIVEFVRQLIR